MGQHFSQSYESIKTDDKNLEVQAPGGEPINAENLVDPVTGETLEENIVPIEFGHHAENIFFPTNRGITPGTYLIEITGASNMEPWTISLTIDGEEIAAPSSTELSRSLGVQVSAPPGVCNLAENECCSDDDCSSDQVCAARTCAMIGYPRFALTWFGSGKCLAKFFVPETLCLETSYQQFYLLVFF